MRENISFSVFFTKWYFPRTFHASFMRMFNKHLHISYNLPGSILDAEDSVVKMTKNLLYGLNSSVHAMNSTYIVKYQVLYRKTK